MSTDKSKRVMKKLPLISIAGTVLLIFGLVLFLRFANAQNQPSLFDSTADKESGRNFRSAEPPIFFDTDHTKPDHLTNILQPVRTDGASATRLDISWTQIGPSGGGPSSFAVDPSNP